MTVLHYQSSEDEVDQSIDLLPNESVLEAMLRSEVKLSYGCRSGVCQSCLMQSSSETIPPRAQQGLTPAQVEQGYFLACCCHPDEDFAAQPVGHSQRSEAVVLDKKSLNDHVIRLRLSADIDYRSGQFVTLWNSHDIARSYSIASVDKHDDYLEFHIKHIEGGKFSAWAWQHLNIGDTLTLQGPLGKCFYTKSDQPMLLSGIGTGLAPLYGIIRDALAQDHKGDIYLFVGANNSRDFYLVDRLFALEKQHKNVHIKLVAKQLDTSSNTSPMNITEGDIYENISKTLPRLDGYKVFICGAESFVKKMKKQCFLSGASMRDISSDPFIPFDRKQTA